MSARSSKVGCVTLLAMSLTGGCVVVAGLDGYELVDCPGGCDAAADSALADAAARTDAPANGGSDAALDAGDAGEAADAAVSQLCDPNDPSLAFCFPFDGDATNGAGGVATVVPTDLAFQAGLVEQAAAFNGSSSNIKVTQSSRLDAMQLMTIEAFVRPNAVLVTGRAGLVDSNGRFGVFVLPTGFQCTNSSSADVVASNTPLVVGQLTHITCVRDGVTLKAYQDGVLVASGAAPGAIMQVPSSTMTIGMNDPTGDFFNGTIDELRIYSQPRTPAQVAADSARGR